MKEKTLKFLSLILSVTILCTVMPSAIITVNAFSNKCGDNITWSIDIENGILTLSGSGDMYNYSTDVYSYNTAPWYGLRTSGGSKIVLNEIHIAPGITSIGNAAFYKCTAVTNVTIPDSVNSIGSNAFNSCNSLRNISMPNQLNSIGSYAFAGCGNLESITLPENITNISAGVFSRCESLTNIIIPNNVTSIGANAFFGCSNIINIILPNGVIDIGGTAFQNCKNINNIIIPVSVTEIGEYCFYGCDNLTDVYYEGSKDQWNEITIYNGNERLENASIHYNSVESDNNIDSDINNKYKHFGHIDNITDLQDTIENVLIDGVVYDFSEEYLAIPHLWPYKYNDYRDQYYYASFNLNENGEIIDFNWMQGVCGKLNEWDEKNSIINVGQYTIAPPDKTLPAGCYAVSAITKNSFPYNEISKWVGDSVRVYSNGDEVFKVIHINYGNGVISSYDTLSTPQHVYIDNIAYPILEDDNLCKTIKDNQFEKVVFTLYDGIVVNVEKLSD